MNWFKALLAGAALGVLFIAFRDSQGERWLAPARPGGAAGATDVDENDEQEPVLGYDGMDEDTLLDWLLDARLNRRTLTRIRRYEAENLGREVIIDAVDDLL